MFPIITSSSAWLLYNHDWSWSFSSDEPSSSTKREEVKKEEEEKPLIDKEDYDLSCELIPIESLKKPTTIKFDNEDKAIIGGFLFAMFLFFMIVSHLH